MKQYLINYFAYNDWANRKLLETVLKLANRDESLRFFSHLIASQNKWHNRVTSANENSEYTWFIEQFTADEITTHWNNSYERWRLLLEAATDAHLGQYVYFNRQADGKKMKVKLSDIIFLPSACLLK